ncbi:efflux RND transporter permease subunit [Klebsiella pneumoniae]|uniref:efflux RND transporter permease subunit n=1 Tax=Klebsiella pneumoniae TaxID=573 RepID=UPI002278CFBC|nr:efflux RND transporter permease subunit [Klebsiella pneumoniae]
MFSRFFVRRPVFAWVIAILIMLAGVLAIRTLPVGQYPDVAPPAVKISATYTGASAETLENSVTQVIEQQLTGLDHLLYFSSTSSSDGSVSITVTFEQGTDPDTAQVQVQNKVQQAESRLPSEVQQSGVTVEKSQSSFLLILAVYDKTNRATSSDISDWLVSNMQDPLARVEGVGSLQVFGAEYAMRVWMDPTKLASYSLMPSDVQSAIEAQNVQVSAGKIGALPSSNAQQLTATVRAQSRLQTPDQFKAIIVKSQADGSVVRLSDVARVEMGSEDYTATANLNGHPAAGIAVMMAPGANALDTATLVKSKIAEFQRQMPQGYDIAYPKDSTEFIKISVEDVIQTLFEAIILVVCVMYLFLQNFRATLIPAVAVPVVLLGTFGVLALFGYSINTLTLFAMVLAIGLLVDDAIVVVENVERIMRDEGLPAREATEKSMGEISGALVAIALVLSAVFLPMAFFGGSTGVIYRQFSVTIISAMMLSVVVALTLTPALCGALLSHSKPHTKGFFGAFNRLWGRTEAGYQRRVLGGLRRGAVMMGAYALICGAMALAMWKLPGSFLPVEDQGEIMVQYTLPAGATAVRTAEVRRQVTDWFLTKEKANTDVIFTVDGFSFSGSGQNAGMAFVSLKNWSQRKGDDNTAQAIALRATKELGKIRDATLFAMTPPSVDGLGQSNGFTFELMASGGTDRDSLMKLRSQLLAAANQSSELQSVRANDLPQMPQLQVDIDNNKAVSLGLSLSDVTDTLSSAWGGTYVNDFIDRGRVKKVYIQGENAAGFSSGAAMDKMEKLADSLPAGSTWAWSGISLQEKLASGQAMSLYAISILVVFLCLAALYESWSVPFSVIMVIPLGLLGAALAATLRGLSNDVYFQVALLTTIGLSSKNAILIVEFAESAVDEGYSLSRAAIRAAQTRLRPIVMTSLAFIAGVLPLAIATGAGANSRVAIGTGIIGGTLTATLLAVFFVPLFFVLVKRLFTRQRPSQE